MAEFTGTTSVSLHGVKEDFLDTTAVINERDAVFWSRVKSGRPPMQVQINSICDDIPPPRTQAIAENSDVTTFADLFERRQTITTYRQQWRVDYGISKATEHTQAYGIRAALAEARAKAHEQMVNSLESSFLSDQDHEDNSNQRPRCRGMGLWTRSYAERNFGGITIAKDGRKDSYYWPSTNQNIGGSLPNLNIDDLDMLSQAIFTSTGSQGKKLMIISGPKFALRFNKLTKDLYGNQRFTAGQGVGKVTDRVTMFEGVFSNLECVPSYFIGWKEDEETFDRDRAYFIDFNRVEKRMNYYNEHHYKNVEGNNLGGWVESMGALTTTNPKCMGQWRDDSGFGKQVDAAGAVVDG